jgi:hypothetical protein
VLGLNCSAIQEEWIARGPLANSARYDGGRRSTPIYVYDEIREANVFGNDHCIKYWLMHSGLNKPRCTVELLVRVPPKCKNLPA